MKTINKFILATIVLLMVGLGCVAAADDTNSTTAVTHETTSLGNDVQSSSTYSTTTKDIQTTTNKDIVDSSTSSSTSKNTKTTTKDTKTAIKDTTTTTKDTEDKTTYTTTKTINKNANNNTVKSVKKEDNTNTKSIKKAEATKITKDNYNLYFRFNKTSNRTESTTLVSAGDTLDLQGTFTNVNFTIDKSKVTITSIGKTAKLYNCTVNVLGLQSAGSSVHNLTITNNNYYGSGIYLNVTKNILVANNTIHVWGPFAFALPADRVNNSLVIDNYLETSCREDTNRTHTATPWGLSYYNNIVNNTVVSDQANGIYFSLWGSGLFQGGYCDYNNVTGNDVTGGDTSWSYTIQIMGTGNIISHNNVRGGYRGISTQDFTNNTITFNEVNGTAQGIFACEGAIVANNTVHVNGTTTGIEIGGDGAIIENNTVTSNSGSCLVISANKATIKNNDLWSTLGYGIYSKGKYTNINITGNTIISGKTGILFRKQSSSKKINYVNVERNKIQSYSEYAIDFSEAGAKNQEDVRINVTESNVLNSTLGQGLAYAYLPPSTGGGEVLPDSNKTYTVTESTYYNYFTDEEIINGRKVLKNDTIILKGSFTNKNFIFNIKTHIIGENCTIRNGTITFTGDADASTLKNVNIINYDKNSLNRHGVDVLEVNNLKITNVTVNNYDPWESFGIFLFSSSGNTITNNTLYTSGDYVNYGLFVYASDLNNITKNHVKLNQSNKPIEYADEIMFNDKIGTLKEVLHNYGIFLVYSSYNVIDQNDVNATSQFKTYQFPVEECKNSLVGIDVYYDSNFNTITKNNVSVSSYGPYEYGMGVLGAPWGTAIGTLNATNNTFAFNKVSVKGGYFATGFIAGLNSVNTLVYNNTFNVQALHNSTQKGDYTYGLTLESCLNTTFVNNTMSAYGASLYSVELFGTKNNVIKNNKFYGEATNPYGIAGYQSSDNSILNNTIVMKKMNYGSTSSALHSDVIPYGKEVIMLMKDSYRNKIMYNTLTTNATEYAVKLTEQAINTTVKENSIVSSKYIGDQAVTSGHKTNIVSNNFRYFTNITAYSAKGTVGYPITIKAKITSTSGNLNNLTVTFRIGLTKLGTSKVQNGIAQITVNATNFLKPTIYTVTASVTGTNFQNATSESKLTLNKTKSPSVVTVSKVNGIIGSTVKFTTTVTNKNGAVLAGNVTFKLNNQVLTTTALNLGKATYTYKIPSNTKSGVYTITVVFNGNEDYLSATGTNKLGVQTQTIATVSSASATIGNPATITAKLTSNGKVLTTGKVTFIVNNKTVGTATIKNGVATYKYTIPTSMTAKKYNMSIKYDGNDTLTAATAKNTLTVNKLASKLTYTKTTAYAGNNVVLTIKVSNTTNGYYPKSGKMTITINKEILKNTNGSIIYGTVNSYGKVIFKFSAPKTFAGKNNLTFKYLGNDQFNAVTSTIKEGLTIINPSKLTVKAVSGKIGNNVTLSATIKDTKGLTVTKGQVTFKVNGKVVKTVNVNNGQATTKYTIPTTYIAKTYKIQAEYKLNNTKIQATGNLNVQRLTAHIKLNKITTTANSVKLTGKILDTKNKAISIASTVNVQIDGKTVLTKQKVTKGNINLTLNIKSYKVGTHKITVTMNQNNQYNKVTNTTTLTKNTPVTVKLTVPAVSGKIGSTVTLKTTVKNSKNAKITNGQVTFKVNGKVVKTVKVTNGQATTKYTIPTTYIAKTYKIEAVYKNSTTTAQATGNLNVQRLTAHIKLNKITTSANSVKLTGKILDTKNKAISIASTVNVQVDGKTVLTKQKVTKGNINLTLNTKSYKVGTHKITVTMNQNNQYNKVTNTTTLTKKKA